ncbi:FtsL-like putative cell division protein [uncultured Bacteroides sp.]|uniref:FtsL-like putative cell division protein n=1 Tax=uncultured Bacteroides sp. TaxID=162156 RepID=UPI00261C9D37|nr:FtsL-like putative cell division protein [uncultured Bacteroides sp.]
MEEQENKNKKQSSSHITLKSILGGDILAHDFLKRQATLLILIVFLTIIYIDNRYASQQELIEIDRLKKELTDIKYDALTISSELTERSRQSKIEEYIANEGTPLQTAATPPYLIKKEKK